MILVTTTTAEQQEAVKEVQRSLLELGYPGVGVVDGDFGLESQGAVLDFLNRNHLIAPPVIDDMLLAALHAAPKKTQPGRVVLATEQDVATKVDAVKQTGWARFVAKVAAIPSGIAAVVLGTISSIGDAIDKLTPLKVFLQDWLSSVPPLTLIVAATSAVAILSFVIWYQTGRAQNSMTAGYTKGTVKDDNKLDTTPTPMTPTTEDGEEPGGEIYKPPI